MARERGQCMFYEYEGKCSKGMECSFWGHCQTCPKWTKKPGTGPARPDNRQKKMDRIRRKEKFDY